VLAIDPFAQFAQHIDSLEALQHIAFFYAFAGFAVARMSCHIISPSEEAARSFLADCVFVGFVAELKGVFLLPVFGKGAGSAA